MRHGQPRDGTEVVCPRQGLRYDMPFRIIFADDQMPHDDVARDAAVKEEICKEFESHRGRDRASTAAAFEDDFSFFQGLLDYLYSEKGVQIIRVRSFGEMQRLLSSYDPRRVKDEQRIDVAIVDLSWWGDKDLPSGPRGRHNRGYELLDCARRRFDEDGVFIPTIAYSQNFYDTPSIMGEVLRRGALPIPKINRRDDDEKKRRMGYEALFSAIEHLKGLHPLNEHRRKQFMSFEQKFNRKSAIFDAILVATFVLLAAALLMPYLVPDATPDRDYVASIIQAVIGVGGASLLGWAWKSQRAARRDLEQLTQSVGLNASGRAVAGSE
jgi:hypothetical protein